MTNMHLIRPAGLITLLACATLSVAAASALHATNIKSMACVRPKVEPEHRRVCDLPHSHGVMCMTAIVPASDRVKPDKARIEAYKEPASNPGIIEADISRALRAAFQKTRQII